MRRSEPSRPKSGAPRICGEERGGKLVYAGKIAGGWTEEQKASLLARVRPLRTRYPDARCADRAMWCF